MATNNPTDRDESLSNSTTSTAREQLTTEIVAIMARGRNALVQAPTAFGKSHTVATMPWSELPEITGGRPVYHISPTKDARDEAARMTEEAGQTYTKIGGHDDVCPMAGDEHDTELPRINGLPVSAWIHKVCNVGDHSFAWAHAYLEEKFKRSASR